RAARADRPRAGEIDETRRKRGLFQDSRAVLLGNGPPRADLVARLEDSARDHAVRESALEQAFVQTVAAVRPVERDRHRVVLAEAEVDRASVDIGSEAFG